MKLTGGCAVLQGKHERSGALTRRCLMRPLTPNHKFVETTFYSVIGDQRTPGKVPREGLYGNPMLPLMSLSCTAKSGRSSNPRVIYGHGLFRSDCAVVTECPLFQACEEIGLSACDSFPPLQGLRGEGTDRRTRSGVQSNNTITIIVFCRYERQAPLGEKLAESLKDSKSPGLSAARAVSGNRCKPVSTARRRRA
jgi:hypothetical protein